MLEFIIWGATVVVVLFVAVNYLFIKGDLEILKDRCFLLEDDVRRLKHAVFPQDYDDEDDEDIDYSEGISHLDEDQSTPQV